MDEQGLWRLFFLTGRPEVYLLIRTVREKAAEKMEQPARTAFGTVEERKTQV